MNADDGPEAYLQALEADATRRVVEKWRKEGFSQQRIRERLERLERCKTETVIRGRHRYVDPASGRPYWYDATTGRSYWDDATTSAPLNDPAAPAPAPADEASPGTAAADAATDAVFAAAADAQRLVAAAAAQVLRTESPAKPRAGRPPRPESPAAIAARVVTAKRSPGADDAYPKYSVSEKTYDL